MTDSPVVPVSTASAAAIKPRAQFLALAEQCGARITGKPDGSEPIEIVFTIAAWRLFDAANAPKDNR